MSARATMTRGRRLVRAGIAGVYAAAAGMVVLVMAGLLGVWADDDATAAVVGLAIVGAVLVASVIPIRRGGRLMDAALPVLVAEPDTEAPAQVRLGPARPGARIAAVVVVVVAATVGTACWFGDWARSWVADVMVAVYLVRFARRGTAAVGLYAAHLDEAGVSVPQLGLRLPWASVASFRVSVDGIDIVVGGPVETVGGLPRRWIERARAAYPPGSTMRLDVPADEAAYRCARRFAPEAVAVVRRRRAGVPAVASR